MAVILPFRPSVGWYGFRSILAKREYDFEVRWNVREGAWYFNVSSANLKPIIRGARICLGVCFGRWSTHTLFREGVMVARIPHGQPRGEPQFDDLGTRVQIWYLTKDEVIEEVMASLQGRKGTQAP